MNEREIKAESAKAAARNMAGMTDKDVMEYVTVKRSWGCLAAAACFSALAGLVAGWVVWVACRG